MHRASRMVVCCDATILDLTPCVEFESVRDFLVLHYQATERRDTPFWRHCAQLPTPPRLQHKREVFRASGQVFRVHEELFTEGSWLQVMLGQGIEPVRHHPLADALTTAQLDEFLGNVRTLVARAATALSTHEEFVTTHCWAAG